MGLFGCLMWRLTMEIILRIFHGRRRITRKLIDAGRVDRQDPLIHVAHRIYGIATKIADHLLDLDRIGEYRPRVRRNPKHDTDLRTGSCGAARWRRARQGGCRHGCS